MRIAALFLALPLLAAASAPVEPQLPSPAEQLQRARAEQAAAEKEAASFEDTTVTLIRQASNTGQLYGSVAVRDIVEALEADGHGGGSNAQRRDR